MVDEGLRYFGAMRESGCEPEKEHYGCVVDMLGRAGRVREADGMVERIPPGMADEVAWTALLRACEARGEAELGKKKAGRAVEMEPGRAGVKVKSCQTCMRRAGGGGKPRKEEGDKGRRYEEGGRMVVGGGGGGEVELFVAAGREHPWRRRCTKC
ncbi:hypothetical protein HPP92_006163 [Vanilla planifolia]|uniref:Pentatricopeptide repeat-containing protein n=1 Tax=Vanilla planifolia TaxID=51239 RepID=A0A835RQX6_VANPL|nr:hypothetical protein HPP92_006163 [Vanilla planifolia]